MSNNSSGLNSACQRHNHHHRACNLCKNGGAYKLQQQQLLHISFDRLENFLSGPTSPINGSLQLLPQSPDNNNNNGSISATSVMQISPPTSGNVTLKSQLRVVQEYKSDLIQLPQESHPKIRKNLSPKKESPQLIEFSMKQNTKASTTQSSVGVESTPMTFYDRPFLSNSHQAPTAATKPRTKLMYGSWQPPKHIVYSNKRDFTNDGIGSAKFSRLARSPSPRHLSAKLIQINMSPDASSASAPGQQMQEQLLLQQSGAANQPNGNYLPACYIVKANMSHDISPHNPFINYFKLKQLITEGKLKIKNVPSFEWARIFQPPTSTVMAGDGDNNNNEETAGTPGIGAGLPMISRGELVSNWVRKADMQPVTKFTRLQLDGLGGLTGDQQLLQQQQLQLQQPAASSTSPYILSTSQTPETNSRSSALRSHPPSALSSSNNAFTPRSSGYLKARLSQRSKQAISAEGTDD